LNGQQKTVLGLAEAMFNDCFCVTDIGGISADFFVVPIYEASMCNPSHPRYDKNASISNQINLRKKFIDELTEKNQQVALPVDTFLHRAPGAASLDQLFKRKGIPVYYGQYGTAIHYMMQSDSYPGVDPKTDFRTKLDVLIYVNQIQELGLDLDHRVFRAHEDLNVIVRNNIERIRQMAKYVLYLNLRNYGTGVTSEKQSLTTWKKSASLSDPHLARMIQFGHKESASASVEFGRNLVLDIGEDSGFTESTAIESSAQNDLAPSSKDEVERLVCELKATKDKLQRAEDELWRTRDELKRTATELEHSKETDSCPEAKRQRTQEYVYTIKMELSLDTKHPKSSEIFSEFGLDFMHAFYVGMAQTQNRFHDLTTLNLKEKHFSSYKHIPEGFVLRDVSVESNLVENASDYIGGIEFTKYALECRKRNEKIHQPVFVRGSCYSKPGNPYGKPHEKVEDVFLLRAFLDEDYQTGCKRP